ncbi:MAG: FAD:protein FMN transferase [Clostridia bacterium]|nr:FAD:protein FMN transferase [Clostridia bacterium]
MDTRNKISGKVSKTVLILSMLLFGFSACSSKSMEPVEHQDYLMGTVISQKVYGEEAQKAIDRVSERMLEIEKRMTINAPGSETDKLNINAGKSDVKLTPDVIYVLNTAKKFGRLSDGAFDVTVGPLVKAWGIFTDNERIPADGEINRLIKLVGYNEINADEKNNIAGLSRQGQVVDLGGIAKGYAGDEAIRIYKEFGIGTAYINLGGNVIVMGKKPDGTEWRVGVQDPRAKNGEIIGVIKTTDKAVVSSGDYERFFIRDNKRYHHILDPRTGYPAESGLIGTTIVADLSIEADALSTATFVLGLEKGMKLIESLNGVDAIFITKEKKVFVTSGLKDKFSLNNKNKEYSYGEKR